MKMRLPDISVKIAVRHQGIKTVYTFNPNEPLQDPRDYVFVPLEYDPLLSG